jgi:lipopolysaccharide/colanic/teichoic acid biosynthesis glycosyltransferase
VAIQTHRPDSTPTRECGVLLAPTVKRALDLIGAILGLLLLAPVMIVVGVAIGLESPGPILFRQRRLGVGGRTFWILKFRTMACDGEDFQSEVQAPNESPGGGSFSMSQERRVTQVGRFLRRSSLDELPQLINVFRGEMSLVGPRPLHLLDCHRLIGLDPGLFEQRLLVRPGLTGLAQVSGRRDLSPWEMLELDRLYVERWSVLGDLAILFRTFGVVLSGRGAI